MKIENPNFIYGEKRGRLLCIHLFLCMYLCMYVCVINKDGDNKEKHDVYATIACLTVRAFTAQKTAPPPSQFFTFKHTTTITTSSPLLSPLFVSPPLSSPLMHKMWTPFHHILVSYFYYRIINSIPNILIQFRTKLDWMIIPHLNKFKLMLNQSLIGWPFHIQTNSNSIWCWSNLWLDDHSTSKQTQNPKF